MSPAIASEGSMNLATLTPYEDLKGLNTSSNSIPGLLGGYTNFTNQTVGRSLHHNAGLVMPPSEQRQSSPTSTKSGIKRKTMRKSNGSTPRSNGASPSQSRKRRIDSDSANEDETANKKGKSKKGKRFLWTEELHRRFVAAVFDVGLKHASPKALYVLLGESANQHNLTTEHIKSHLQKFRLHSQRSREQFLKYHDEAVRHGNELGVGTPLTVYPVKAHTPNDEPTDTKLPNNVKHNPNPVKTYDTKDHQKSNVPTTPARSNSHIAPSPVPIAPNTDSLITSSTEGLRRQVQMQARSLQLQAEYQEALQRQLLEQQRLQQELQEKLQLLQAQAQLSGVAVPIDSSQPMHLPLHGASDSVPLENKSRLQIQLAMQSQMNMHRQMLLRQAGQVALHGGTLQQYNGVSPEDHQKENAEKEAAAAAVATAAAAAVQHTPASAPLPPQPAPGGHDVGVPNGSHDLDESHSQTPLLGGLEPFDWRMSEEELFQFLL